MLSEDQQDQLLLSLFATAEVMGQQLTPRRRTADGRGPA